MEINQASRLCMPMCQRSVNSDISEDITLPDYYPEIRRVLYLKESIPVPASFVGGSKIDVNGVVDYILVYLNGEGEICSAPMSGEYSFSVPVENVSEFELGEGVTVMAHTVADSSNVRVSAPRRLQIRSHLRTNITAYGKRLCEERTEGLMSEESVERLYGETECAEVLCENTDVIALADEYTLPSENCRVALADSSVMIKDSRIDGELIRISGEVLLKLLVMCDGRAETVLRKLPFDAEADLDGVDAGSEALLRIGGSVTDLSINTEESRVAIEANAVLEVCLCQNKTVRYTRDIYSTEQKCEVANESYSLPIVRENKNAVFNQAQSLSCEDINFPENAEIVDVRGSSIVEEVSYDNGRYTVSGSCKYNIICCSEGEYSHIEARAPFSCELDGEGAITGFDACASVNNCRARIEGDNIGIESELSLGLTLMGGIDTSIVDRVVFGELRECGESCWRVRYVSLDDDSWSIAKHYGVRESDIKGDPVTDRYVMIEK